MGSGARAKTYAIEWQELSSAALGRTRACVKLLGAKSGTRVCQTRVTAPAPGVKGIFVGVAA